MREKEFWIWRVELERESVSARALWEHMIDLEGVARHRKASRKWERCDGVSQLGSSFTQAVCGPPPPLASVTWTAHSNGMGLGSGAATLRVPLYPGLSPERESTTWRKVQLPRLGLSPHKFKAPGPQADPPPPTRPKRPRPSPLPLPHFRPLTSGLS